ncbi:MAG: hypothetical protein P0S94_04315, partial [Simkaniaceae bacterium]|nr:hypothetical protein [Simkaniaceae bacterium]
MSLDLSSMGAFAPCPTLSTPPRGYKGGEFKLYEEARKNYDDARVVYTRLTSSSLGTSRIEKLTVD